MPRRLWKVEAILFYGDEQVDWVGYDKDGPFREPIIQWFPLSMLNKVLVRVTHVPSSRSRAATVVGVKNRAVLVRRGSYTGTLLATIKSMKQELA